MSVMAMAAEPEALVGGPFIRADLDRTPDDGRRYEIIDGVLIVSAAPGRVHQRAVARLKAYRQVAKVVGEESDEATLPFPVTIVPADLAR
jgi:hypothetical protein